MPIQLDKILSDIANERVLHPNFTDATKKDTDDAWTRVGKSNKLSVHEARSIFKVLQKKYEQEKLKDKSAWKLFHIMDEIHQKIEIPSIKEEEDTNLPLEEDEEYEMLEVQEEDEQQQQQNSSQMSTGGNSTGGSGASTSDSDSPPAKSSINNSIKTAGNSSQHTTPDKDEKPPLRTFLQKSSTVMVCREERKLLNNQASTTVTSTRLSGNNISGAAAAASLQKKGIIMKKATPLSVVASNNGCTMARNSSITSSTSAGTKTGAALLESGKTIQLPESIKRKLNEEQHNSHHASGTQSTKKLHLGSSSLAAGKTATAATSGNHQHHSSNNSTNNNANTLLELKQERIETDGSLPSHGINIITIPAHPTNGGGVVGGATSSTAATIASTATSTNGGYSPTTIDYNRSDIISFDAGNTLQHNGPLSVRRKDETGNTSETATGEIINLGNFDNALPPTFFKNLCNSSRHEALGLYVANVMNRLQSRSAAKLEISILRAIIDIQSDELE